MSSIDSFKKDVVVVTIRHAVVLEETAVGRRICHTVSVSINVSKRAHVILPIELVADIDRLVGKRGRSAFLAEVARDEIMRRQQRLALQASAGAWKDEDHPELKGGSAAWVRQMRSESERRFEQIQQQHRDSE